MAGTTKLAQVIHISQMYLSGALSRAQFEEFTRMAADGRVTKEIAQEIAGGRFKFTNTFADVHLAKARKVWNQLGKRVLGGTFKKYLNGTDNLEAIPTLPNWPSVYLTDFDREVLVDGRVIDRIGLTEACRLAGLAYVRGDDALVPYEPACAETGVRWMRAQSGRKNRNRKVVDCRETFEKYEVGMAADEGLFTYVDDARVIDGHVMDLPGSVPRGNREDVAYLGVIGGKPKLSWYWEGNSDPKYGSATRGKRCLSP